MKENSFLFSRKSDHSVRRARAKYLTQAILLEEKGPSGIISSAIFLTFLLLVGGAIWATLTEVKETALAPGEVIPAGLSVKVQHLEGGLVNKLHARDGQQVSQGEILLTLHDKSLKSELAQLQVREAALNLQAERLEALVEDRNPNFALIEKNFPNLAQKQRTIYSAQKRSQENERLVFLSQIKQKENELMRQKNQVKSRQKEVLLLIEQVVLREKLNSEQLVAKTELLSTETRLAEAQGALQQAEDGVTVAESAVEEIKQRQLERSAIFLKEIEIEAGQVASELAEVTQSIVRIKERIERTVITSPVDGIVQNLSISGGHAVIEPGQTVMQLIPIYEDLVVDARVSPTDIGHVKIGDRADIRVDSYDTARFGLLQGEVSKISATTYLDESQQPYYKAEISLATTHLGNDAAPLRIIPGMTVSATIQTGHKTLMEYLLRPVQRGLSTSFGER